MGEWGKWAEAVRGLPQNPLAAYFTLSEKRNRTRGRVATVWRVVMAAVALALLVLAGMYFTGMLSGGVSYRPVRSVEEVHLLAVLVLAGISGLAVITGLRRLFATCVDAFRILAGEGAEGKGKARRLVLDDMASTTTLTDHEIAAGMLYVLVPRLSVIALGAGVLFWLWLLLLEIIYGYGTATGGALRMLVTAPLTVAGITLAGTLAAVATLCWLIVLGHGSRGPFYGSAAATMICLGHLVMVPLLAGSGVYNLNLVINGSLGGMVPFYIAQGLAVLGFPAVMYCILLTAAARPGKLASLGWLIPLAFPFGLFILAIAASNVIGAETPTLALMAFLQGWMATCVGNLSAVPSAVCLPSLVAQRSILDFIVEVQYLLLLAQLVLMAAAGLDGLRRAVHVRRQCGG